MKLDIIGQDGYIETSTGRALYINEPEFQIFEIAWSLTFLCRYTGHCVRFYSVAEHSVLVAKIMEHFDIGDPFEGLMHDAAESVINDLNSPNKHLLPSYKKLENHYESALRAQYGLPKKSSRECKDADWIALCIEAKQLLPSGGKDWNMPEGTREKAQEYVEAHNPLLGFRSFEEVRNDFMFKFERLKP